MPEAGDDIVIVFLVLACPEGVEKKGQVFLRQSLVEDEFPDTVGVEFKGEIFAPPFFFGLVDDFVFTEQLRSGDEKREFRVRGEMTGKLFKELLGEFQRHRIGGSIGPVRLGRLIEELQDAFDRGHLGVFGSFGRHSGRHHLLCGLEIRHSDTPIGRSKIRQGNQYS